MKKTITGAVLGLVVLSSSCKKYLDINTNPNSATSATPELILPQALVNTASSLSGYNSYGSQTVGYAANAGGYGGFGEAITYNYTTSHTGLWGTTYDNLEDYQAILDQTKGKDVYNYFNAASRIMKAYNFQMLVDAFNDVPYTEALKGGSELTPKYDKAADVYKDLAAQLDTAINLINAGKNVAGEVPLGASDVIFGGDVDSWKKFANTIKLRIIIRAGDKVTFNNKTFTADGFLTSDALINPGYSRDNGKQNPLWNAWAYGYTGSAANKAWMPNTFIFSFYNGTKLLDTIRGKATYYQFPSTGTNRLGVESNSIVSSPTGSFWFSGTNRNGASNGSQVGILKGPNAGMPAMLAAESYFLQAEGVVRGLITGGDDAALFKSGITASFNYIYSLPDKSVAIKAADSAAKYIATNSSSGLANYALNTTTAQKVEAIITQKYIALNFIHGHEAWNEYRRTKYPTVAAGNGTQTFASSVSESTRADKLPTRILYPTSEGSYNSENVPGGITPFTSLIFWAQ